MTLSKPSDAPSGAGISAVEGAACVFIFRERGSAVTDFGEKDYVAADVLVVDSNVGKMSTPTKLGNTPQPLTAKAGDFFENVRIFQGWIRGAFNGQTPGGMVGGTPTVVFEDTKQGKNQPVWKLIDLDDAATARAEAAIEAHAAKLRQVARPSESAAPAVAQAEPSF